MSALGRELPVVTLREFFALATCYASSTGRSRPKAVIDENLKMLIRVMKNKNLNIANAKFFAFVAIGLLHFTPTLASTLSKNEPMLAPLTIIHGIPFIPVSIGSVKTDLLLDSGGGFGVSLANEIIQKSNSVKILEHKSKFSDVAGNVYEVSDILASDVSVAGVHLASPLTGSVHHTWGLDIAAGETKEPEELSQKSLNGAIGLGAFKGRALLLDYTQHRLGMYSPGLLPDLSRSGWKPIHLKYDNEGAQVELVSLGKKMRFILDTGANLSLLKPSSIQEGNCAKEQSTVHYCGTKDIVKIKTSDGLDLKDMKFIMAELKEVTADGILGGDFFLCIN